MPTTYQQCPEDVTEFAAKVLQKYHPDLAEAGVTIEYLFANSDAEDERPLMMRGQACAAIVKLYPLDDRAAGCKDAKIRIDEKWWKDAGIDLRTAMLDHEHHHLQFAKVWRNEDQALQWKTDDLGRPKLKMKNHDAEAGVFFDVIQRHAEKSLDFRQVNSIGRQIRKLVQKELPWG